MTKIFTAFAPKRVLARVNIHAGGWISVFVIATVTFLLFIEFGRVVADARQRYEVYLFEKETLALLQNENDKLVRELEYYQSYEYKKLYARDYLHLAEPGERLYRILGEQQYYEIVQTDESFFDEGDFSQWWARLL